MKKNFTKILLAVPAFVIAASCAKEVVPVQEVEFTGKVFTTEFEGVKTTLDTDRTPVWVEGDAIGVTTAADDNVQCQLLDVEKGIFNAENIQGTAPYYAVYPYSAGNTFDGDVLTATIPSVQTLAEGQNVASGALVSACKSTTMALSFKNCVSLLQITIPVENVKEVVVTATAEDEKLTGKFTMDLSEDALAPTLITDAAEPTVTLLPAGTSFAAGTYYIAVAPVTLSAIQIDFTNTSDETVTVKKTLTTVLARSSGSNLGSFFTYEINTADDLIKWAAQSAKFTSWDVVTLKSDITLSEEQAKKYVEAENFSGIFTAKKSATENFRISGLTKPLFNKFYGRCDGVDLESNIVYDGSYGDDNGCGMFSHYNYNTVRKDAAVSNVNTYGTIECKFSTSLAHKFNLGGISGATDKTPISNCTNNASIFFTNLVPSSYVALGGIVGTAGGAATATVTNCKNYGIIKIQNATAIGQTLACGGLVGYTTQAITFANLENYGAITMTPESKQQGNRVLGGIVGQASVGLTIKDSKNDAPITLTPGSNDTGSSSVAGGILGYAAGKGNDVKIDGCTNTDKGTILMSGGSSYSCPGGIVGWSVSNMNVIGCTNNADITFKGSSAKDLRMGGIIGNCANDSKVTKSLIGSAQSGCSNTGTITNEGGAAANAYIGGILGCSGSKSTDVVNCHNTGDIINNTTAGMGTSLCMGGITGYSGSKPCVYEDCTCKCEIVKKDACSHKAVYAGTIHGNANTTINAQHNGLGGSVLGVALTSENFLSKYYGKETTYNIDKDDAKQKSYFIQ